MPSAAPPYAGLTPDIVLDALASAGFDGDGRLLALNSFENRVYQAWRDDAPPLVAKFYRPGRWTDAQIAEEHAFVAELATAEIPVVAPLALAGGGTLATFGGFRFAVYARRGGRAPELEDRATLEWMGRFIARMHVIGAARPFGARPPLNVERYGDEPRAYVLAHGFVPEPLRASYESATAQALAQVAHCHARAGDVGTLRLHGDCHAGNVLWTDAGPHFVDFDDCQTGPAVQDLWMLLSGERADMTRQLGYVLDGYEQFRAFDRRELHLIEALRTLRLIHYAGWLARRWDDPAFPAAFPWFNSDRYWQDRILELREQIALMDEPPLEP